MDAIHELLITEVAAEKLGARGIDAEETQQLIDNRYVILRKRGRARRSPENQSPRRLIVGRTNGGRVLTLVVERTIEPTTWLIVTGWSASVGERKMLGS